MPLIFDTEEEKQILADGFDCMIPVGIRQRAEEEPEICAYASVEPEIRAFYETWGKAPFGRKPLSALRQLLLPHFARWGYEDDPRHFDRYGCVFIKEAGDNGGVPEDGKEKKTGNVCRITDPAIPNRLTFDIPDLLSDGCRIYGVLADGKLVSAAVTQAPIGNGAETVEIGVETAPGYRRRGYGGASVAALTAHLLSEGCRTVKYACFYDNRYSRRIAEKNGYRMTEKFFYYLLRKRKDR